MSTTKMTNLDAVIAKNAPYEDGETGSGAVNDVVFPWVECQLTGGDGNAFAIMGAVMRSLKNAGLREEAEAYSKDAQTSDSYDSLLQHAMTVVEVS